MGLRSLLLSSDDETVRILRRVLSDLEISVEHCAPPRPRSVNSPASVTNRSSWTAPISTRRRAFCGAAKASPANNRAVAIVLVDSSVGVPRGFRHGRPLRAPQAPDAGARTFQLPRGPGLDEARTATPGARGRAGSGGVPRVRKRDHLRGKPQSTSAKAAWRSSFPDRMLKDNSFRFSLELPGMEAKLEVEGEIGLGGGHNESRGPLQGTSPRSSSDSSPLAQQPLARARAGRSARHLPPQRSQPGRLLS